jgi:predicted ATPase/DNA-binding CsgD family transcriptional regulator
VPVRQTRAVASPSQLLIDAGVSAREAEILAAVGEHLTNAEIGARLFISVRTVESHVSSLLRKLGAPDRRALAALAGGLTAGAEGAQTRVASPAGEAAAPVRGVDLARPTAAVASRAAVGGTAPGAVAPLPAPLTSFVGRVFERAELAAALEENRLVTAVGPGGVGKTRLALAVAGDLADRYEGGVWYVDLVPVTDPAMVAPTVASVLGLGGSSARPAAEMVEVALVDREALLVLDNCEHLVDATVVFVERVLARCPRVVVLATSRARLVVPFERVFAVPGLSLSGDAAGAAQAGEAGSTGEAGGAGGDAEELFLARAAAVGSPVTTEDDRRRVAGICRALDGLALAIELAAARLPALGLDGLESGLADRLRLLAGGSRLDERHRSLRATLDWSYALAEPLDRAVLRRVAVFAAPFTIESASAVAGFDPVTTGDEGEATAGALGRLAEQSLVEVVPGPAGTRYRVLESIRQYGDDRSDDAGEGDAVRERHLAWCTSVAVELSAPPDPDPLTVRSSDRHVRSQAPNLGEGAWQDAFDGVVADLRAALRWASGRPERRNEAHRLALALGGLAYRRGLSREAQHRYEDAAGLGGGREAAAALHHAAGAAATRQAGDEAIALYRAAADTALAAGDGRGAACDLVALATLVNRGPGIISQLPPPVDVGELLAEARPLASGHPEVEAALVVAEVFGLDEATAEAEDLARQAVDQARAAGEPELESGALDALTAVLLARHQPLDAAAATRRRMDLLTPLPPNVDLGFELIDAHHMATETHLAVGDLRSARRYTELARRLPTFREGHLGAVWFLMIDALAGDWDGVPEAAARFRVDWERVGQPAIGSLGIGTCAVAMVVGIRGDGAERDRWLDITASLRRSIDSYGTGGNAWSPLLDAHVLLHQGRYDEAASRLASDPDEMTTWFTGLWRQWYSALWAEAGVLTGLADAAGRLSRARAIAAGNPVASALVDRAEGLALGDRGRLLAAARALDAAGCHYQRARTLVLAGGSERAAGEAALGGLGAAPMAVPPAAPA